MNVGRPIQISRCNCLTQMLFLVQFAQTYLSFRLPELDSVIEMNGLKKEDVYSMYVFLQGLSVYDHQLAQRVLRPIGRSHSRYPFPLDRVARRAHQIDQRILGAGGLV